MATKIKVNKGHEIAAFSDDPWQNLIFAVIVRAGRDAHFGENGVQYRAREFLNDPEIQEMVKADLGIEGAREVFKFK